MAGRITTVAFDMDGVIADFATGVRALSWGVDPDDMDISELWKMLKRSDRVHGAFYEFLNVLPGAAEMVATAQSLFDHVFILSACGSAFHGIDRQKRRWLDRYFDGIDAEFVTRSADKAKFASESTVLVDDRLKAITPFVDAGGTGILHKSVEETLNYLTIMASTPR